MNSLAVYGFIAIGGALGAMLRYFIAQQCLIWFGKDFPFGTLLVNVIGSFFLGLVYALIENGVVTIVPWRTLVGIGLLGALTTFSTFSVDTLLLIKQQLWIKAALNVSLNVGLCMLFAGLAMYMVEHR